MDISNEIIEMFDSLIESKFSEKMAKLNKLGYDALIKEGFTKEQAIKIITSNKLFGK